MRHNQVAIYLSVMSLATALTCMGSTITFADYSSATAGTIGATPFTLTGFENSGTGSGNLSGTDYSAGPGSANEQVLLYAVRSNWTISFDSPVPELYVYANGWRGTFAGAPGTNVSYTFDQPFTILSGLGSAAVSDTTIVLPQAAFHNGILRFTNIMTLNLTTDAAGSSIQAATFGTPVPEPANVVLFASGFGLMVIRLRRKRRA